MSEQPTVTWLDLDSLSLWEKNYNQGVFYGIMRGNIYSAKAVLATPPRESQHCSGVLTMIDSTPEKPQEQYYYPVWIYALIDPVTNHVRYIGKSTDPPRRLRQHLRRQDANPHLWNWVKSLIDVNKKPMMVILCETDRDNWGWHEASLIAHYRNKGEPLTNMESGGGSGYEVTPETKERMRVAQLNRDPEVNERISKSLKSYFRENGTPQRGRVTPKHVREKQRQAKLKNPTRAWLGKKRSNKDRKAMSLGRKRYFDRIGRQVESVIEQIFYQPELLDMSNRAMARALGVNHHVTGDAREMLCGFRSKP